MAEKRHGLVLSLGGAPATPHTVPPLPGYFRADLPRPVGPGYDISLEQAREVHKDEGAPLSLVEIKSEKDQKIAEEQHAADLEAGRVAAAQAQRGNVPVANGAQITDEVAATSGKES